MRMGRGVVAVLVMCLLVAVVSGVAWAGFPKPCTTCASTPPAPKSGLCTPCVLLNKMAPAEVRVGEAFEYQIQVVCNSGVPLRNVVVTDEMPDGFRYTGSEPQHMEAVGNRVKWLFASMQPRETQVIRVFGEAMAPGQLMNCVTATYEIPACLTINVIEPKIELVKTATPEVLVCEPIMMQFTVKNAGTGALTNVTITDQLPDGLVTAEGSTSISIPVGTLAAGQSKQFSKQVRATRTGEFNNTAVATADGGLTVESSAKTVVRQPVLAIEKTCQEKIFAGQNTTYQIKVTNKGDIAADGVTVSDSISGGQVVSATDGGQVAGNVVNWSLGTLMPNDSRTVSVTVKAAQIGRIANTATAKGACAEPVSDDCSTEVAGIPAVLLEVIDLVDPVPVGGVTTYVITVTNQGSLQDTNIAITVNLEAQQEYVASSGVTQGTADGKKITFTPLPVLGVGQKASWQLQVKALDAGDVRLHVSMDTDQLTREVQETEATNFYK